MPAPHKGDRLAHTIARRARSVTRCARRAVAHGLPPSQYRRRPLAIHVGRPDLARDPGPVDEAAAGDLSTMPRIQDGREGGLHNP